MYRISILLLLMSSAFCLQARHGLTCAERQKLRQVHPAAKPSSVASTFTEQYDVIYVKLDISLSNLNTDVSGNTRTIAKVTNPSGMSQYAFELNSLMTIDSVLVNGTKLSPLNVASDVYAVNLSSTLAAGTSFTAQVFYHGTAVNGSGFFTHGLNYYHLSSGTDITFSLSDPNLAKDWWACKQSLTDKIDSADLWFTVPTGTRAGSNGLLQHVTPVGTSSVRYEWKTRYPIEYYLIACSVAPFDDHEQTVHFSGSTDSMAMVHYVIDTASFYPQYKSAIDSTPGMVDYLSTIYGRYPFWKEKYGHCIAPLGGGMEHQTMTTLGVYQTPLIAHELGHQWWGDCVTYAGWRDIWLSEGWASYTEQLYVEHFRGIAAAQSYRTTVYNRVMSSAKGAVYVDDTTNVNRIFDSRLTYDKGAAVAHMLRYLAPSDSLFFKGLRAYLQQFAYRTAITADFQQVMETTYGYSLDTFFKQWVYGEGYPTYTASWNQIGNMVYIRLDQTTSAPTIIANFALPVPLKLTSPSGDTLVKLYLNGASNTFAFKWQNAMDGLSIDPNNDIVNRANPVNQDFQLGISKLAVNHLKIFPNPTSSEWQITGIPEHASLSLYDAAGRLIQHAEPLNDSLTLENKSLTSGIYTLIIQCSGKEQIIRKLQKR